GAYALLTIAVAQSVLVSIQERFLHEHNFNTFVDKLPALQTMEAFLYQSLKMGLLLLTLSLISGYYYIDDFFTQKLTFKTILSVIAWIGFAGILLGHKVFGWRGKLVTVSTQTAFAILVLSYYGTKFFLEIA
ncbi:MAG: cytochrome c biogenesis protein CcsA, partial [Gammaproteobacteria bacterium]|nr:cytochrome c biogenesis protein CcsA [Gammaproteobacteria bacterium]